MSPHPALGRDQIGSRTNACLPGQSDLAMLSSLYLIDTRLSYVGSLNRWSTQRASFGFGRDESVERELESWEW